MQTAQLCSSMDVVVQPGVNWVDLNERIESSGLFLPMDPSPTATIGGIQLAALELMDDVQMGVLNKHGSAAVRRWQFPGNPTLFLKFSGTKEAVHGDIASVKSVIEPFSPSKILFAENKQEEIDLWSGRKEALWTMTSIKPQGFNIWSTNVAVPISKLAELIDISKQASDKLGVFASIVGHVGDGNFHQAVMYDTKNEEHVQAVETCVHKMMDRAVELGGTVSGEHGIGIGKKECLFNELGVDTIALMKALKSTVDPKWIMNPGKVFDAPKRVIS
ncbi:D-lactate dehydrogenase [Colletotrichum sp. SAR 10_98]|nr:D-lactate dehydrogenase [Colletotrichum sp. SAR 10_98]